MNVCAFVGIKSSFDLIEMAAILSEQICGGIEFGGQDDNVREEVPAVYTQRDFLGLRIVLYGGSGEYGLDVEQWGEQVSDDIGNAYIDFSKHLLMLVSRISGLQAHSNGGETQLN